MSWGAYNLFFRKEPAPAPARPITKVTNLELSHYPADVAAIGFTRTRVSDGDTVIGAKEQIQLTSDFLAMNSQMSG